MLLSIKFVLCVNGLDFSFWAKKAVGSNELQDISALRGDKDLKAKMLWIDSLPCCFFAQKLKI